MKRLLAFLLVFLAGTTAAAEITSDELGRLSDEFVAETVAAAAADDRPAITLFRTVRDAIAEGRFADAVDGLKVLAGRHDGRAEGGYDTWYRLGLALQKQGGGPEGLPPVEASAAAYRAYELADTAQEQLQSLLLLGSLLSQSTGQEGTERIYVVEEKTAYQIYEEIGRLAGENDPFEVERRRLAPRPFRLDRVVYPLPPGTSHRTNADCEVQWQDPQEQFAESEEALRHLSGPAEAEIEFSDPGGEAVIEGMDDDIAGGDPDYPPFQRHCSTTDRRNTCLVFSRPVAPEPAAIASSLVIRRIDPDPGLTAFSGESVFVPVGDLAMNVQDRNICFADLRFGSRYRFELLESFRSLYDEELVGPHVADIIMENRPPTLGFQRGAYVLPSHGEREVVVKAVNVPEASILIRRIGDFQLIREMVRDNIVGEFDQADACFILNNLGEEIGSGTIFPGRATNMETELSLPFGELLDARNEWLARTGGSEEAGATFERAGRFSFTLFGDLAAAAAQPGRAGVYVLFGDTLLESDVSEEDSSGCRADRATQWLVITNLGLTVQRSHSAIYAIVRELDSGEAVPGVRIEFVARSGEVLADAVTDEFGMASIDARLGRGRGGNELIAVMAYSDNDFTFLDLKSDSISLADRGFEGRAVPPDYDAFIAPTRDIFRPGETVEAVVLMRSAAGLALEQTPPVEVALRNARGILVGAPHVLSGDALTQMAGGYFFTATLPETLPEGPVSLEARVGGDLIGSRSLEVRYYQPDTVGLSFDEPTWLAEVSETGRLELSGVAEARYLFALTDFAGDKPDAPAAGLEALLEVRVEPAASPVAGCFDDFVFGRDAESFSPRLFRGLPFRSDEDGRIAVTLGRDGVPSSHIPLQAVAKLSVVDARGRAQERSIAVPLHHAGRHWIGLSVRPDPGRRIDEPLELEAIVLDENLEPVRAGAATLELFRKQDAIVWQDDGNSWQFVAAEGPLQPFGGPQRVDLTGGATETGAGCAAAKALPVELGSAGTYVARLSFADAVTELEIGQGWTTSPDGKIQPDSLVVRADKAIYAPGETIDISVETPHQAGKVLGEIVLQGKVVATFEADIGVDGAHAAVPISESWDVGDAHIYVTSFRRAEEDSIQRGPARATGGTRIRIGAGPQTAVLSVRGVAEVYRHEDLQAGLQVEVLASGFGDDAWISLAAVDEGILALTDFRTPDPREHYFGGRRLDFDVYDTYGRIVYGVGGDGGELRELRGSSYDSANVVVFHGGIEKAQDGRAVFNISADTFPVSFLGRVRLMAMAWDAGNLASAEDSFVVRDPVIARLAVPQFMAPGDVAMVPLTTRNIENAGVDRIAVEVEVLSPLSLDVARADAAAIQCSNGQPMESCLRFELPALRGAPESTVSVPLAAGSGLYDPTRDNVILTYEPLRGETGESVRLARVPFSVEVRDPYPSMTFLAGTATVEPGDSVTLSATAAKQITRRLSQEQPVVITTRVARHALAPVFADDDSTPTVNRLLDLAEQAQYLLSASAMTDLPLSEQEDIAARLDELVRRIGVLQAPEGGFVSDNSDGDPDIGETAFAVDLLDRARGTSDAVEDIAVDRAVGWLLSRLLNRVDPSKNYGLLCERDDLYALVVLARLNRVSELAVGQTAQFCAELIDADPASRLLLAAAYNAFGLTKEAELAMAGLDLGALLAQSESGDMQAVLQAVALNMEQDLGGDPLALVQSAGLTNEDTPLDSTTESWLARLNLAVLSVLEEEQPQPFAAETLSCTPEAMVGDSFFDGVDMRPVAFDGTAEWFLESDSLVPMDADAPAFRCTNNGSETVYAAFHAKGVPADLGGAGSQGLEVALTISGVSETEPATLVARQYEPIYFLLDVTPTTSYQVPERLAASQILPTGFEVVDRGYKSSWQDVLGAVADRLSMSPIEYAEVSVDRWIGMPVPASGRGAQANYRLGFSLRPTLQGTYVLPPLTVRDLNNPRRIAWTDEQRIIVEPAN